MKAIFSVILTALVLLFAVPARAQNRAGAMATSSLRDGGGGMGGNGSTYIFSAASLSGGPSNQSTADHCIFVRGTDDGIFNSTFVPYPQAIKMGLAALAFKPKTVVEVAAETRAENRELAAQQAR
jgi:hypothetical protein